MLPSNSVLSCTSIRPLCLAWGETWAQRSGPRGCCASALLTGAARGAAPTPAFPALLFKVISHWGRKGWPLWRSFARMCKTNYKPAPTHPYPCICIIKTRLHLHPLLIWKCYWAFGNVDFCPRHRSKDEYVLGPNSYLSKLLLIQDGMWILY